MKTIATICARGGSKGLPRKNIKLFAGLPLIAHSILQALACPLIEAVYVSTDDEEIAQIARQFGAQVPYLRPAELATDQAAKIPCIEHLVQHLEADGLTLGWVVDLQPTSPLRRMEDLLAALSLRDVHELHEQHDQTALIVSVTEASHNPYYSLVEVQADGSLALCKPFGGGAARRQDVPEVFGLNGAIYVWPRAALAQAASQGFWSVPMRPSRMPKRYSMDIDDGLDFEIAEFLHTQSSIAADHPKT